MGITGDEMIKIEGKHNSALCFAATLEESAARQIKTVCDQAEFAHSKIRIMPDVHSGKGCTIGTTMTIVDKIVPGMVGVDIGCGMETVKLRNTEIDFARLDSAIREFIPCGFDVRDKAHPLSKAINLKKLHCVDDVNLHRAVHSIGTLGGGNHFIEVAESGPGALYLVVHSGSRHLGCEVAEYYQNEGFRSLCGNAKHQITSTIKKLKTEGRVQEIETAVKDLRAKNHIDLPKDLAYVEGKLFQDYIDDMKIIQHFAVLNRQAMVEVILNKMGLTAAEHFTTIHNYIDTDEMILRKGAVSAKAGEKLLIPINMRDGSLICMGKGNPDWNYSAPHGAGRLMSRTAAFRQLSMDQYQTEMRGVFSTCVVENTLDESPMAYKSMDEIMAQITPTADVIEQIRPLYNFKASE